MDALTAELLHQIGRRIDGNVYPRVWNGGYVMPDKPPVFSTSGLEQAYERWKASRSATGSWERTAGWQGSAGGAWEAGAAASVLGPAASAAYGKELNDLYDSYPGSAVFPQARGFWLVAKSLLLPQLDRCAIFLIGVDVEAGILRSWAFWKTPISLPRWIGPRHTNFSDGSICAFEPTDLTWRFGDPLVSLLDYYSVWAVRHLYLEVEGRWPGYQAVNHPYERILEFREDEHCGCNSSGKLYRDCCYERDRRFDQLKLAIDFSFWSGGAVRRPPVAIDNFACGRSDPPDLIGLQELH